MKLYELQNSAIADELRKTAQSIPAKTQSEPGLNPDVEDPSMMGIEGTDAEINPNQMDPGMGADPMGGMGMDPGMGGGFGGPPMNSPEPGMQEPPDPEELERITKKVDSTLYTMVKDLPFATEYDHDSSKMGPYEILQMDNDELSQLRTIAKNKLNSLTMTNKYGNYDDPGVHYFQDMISYVEHVIQAKNKYARDSKPDFAGSNSDKKDKPAKKN